MGIGNLRALNRCQENYDHMLPPEYWEDDDDADITRDDAIHDSCGMECDESWCEGCHVEGCEDYKKGEDGK